MAGFEPVNISGLLNKGGREGGEAEDVAWDEEETIFPKVWIERSTDDVTIVPHPVIDRG